MSISPVSTHVPEWTLGDRLRKIRRESGMTVAEFAEQIGVGRASLGHYETDRFKPSDVVALAKRVQLVTGVPAAWTLGVNDDSPSPDGERLSIVHPPGLEPGTHWLRAVASEAVAA